MTIFPLVLSAAPASIAAIRLDGLTVAREEEVLAVLPFTVGDPFTPAAIQQGIDILRTWGIFTDVAAATTTRADGVAVQLTFTEAKLIGEIGIRGNYPFIQNRVRRYLTIRPGDPYRQEVIDQQVQRIIDFYSREGYRNTTVTTHEEWQPYTSDMRVEFHIVKGTLYSLGKVTVHGNTVFPVGRFISVLNPWRTYNQRRAREALTKLTALYRRRHYPKARIRIVEESLNPRFHEIDLTINVEEGPYVATEYIGNTHITDHELTKAITIYTEGRTDEFELDASADGIRKLYQRRGFPDAVVTASRKLVDDNRRIDITFNIAEGARRTIRRVLFEGNQAMSRGRLRQQILTQPASLLHKGSLDPALLAEDAKVLEQFYKEEGFLNARVDAAQPTPANNHRLLDVTIPIVEGPRYTIGDVQFIGNIHATHESLLKSCQLRPKTPADLAHLDADKEAIRLYFVDHGYPYARIDQTVRRDDAANTVTIAYTIAEGSPVHIGQVLLIGDFITSQKAIRRAMTVKPGDAYSERRILESQLGIRRLGAFRSVAIETIGLKEGATTVPLRVRVEEEKPFIVDIDLGYSTDQNVTGSLNFTNINSFGWAKRTMFRLTGGRRLSRGEIGWLDPRFLGRDVTWTANSWIQYENKIAFNYLQAGGGFGFFRQYHRTGFSLRYNLERNNFLGGNSVAADSQSLRNNILSTIGLGISFDTRNNFADPTKGFYASAGSDFFNEIKGARANFVRLHSGLSHYLPIFTGVVLSQYGRIAGIQPFGSHISVPSNKLLFLGGDDTIRGFPEDSLGPTDLAGNASGGRVRWIYNAELSARIYDSLKIATFFDIGSLTNTFREINHFSVRESFGLGLRYATPVGPIRADYGFKLNRRPGESTGRLHFTFGHIF